MAGESQARGKSKSKQGRMGDEVRKANGKQEWSRCGDFVGHCKDFGSYLE